MASGQGSGSPDDFLETTIQFPDGQRFTRLQAITDLRKDPGEARILYTCKRTDGNDSEEFILKVKAQWPGPQNVLHDGPSPSTAAELKALEAFREKNVHGVPHLITWKKAEQPPGGVHPGGYLVYVVMTKMPGVTLWDIGYWSLPEDERSEIQAAFVAKLGEVRALSIAPYDCALRNVMWDMASKRLSIIDFEHYRNTLVPIDNETTELERWGLKSRPVPGTWFVEWGLQAKEAIETGIVGS